MSRNIEPYPVSLVSGLDVEVVVRSDDRLVVIPAAFLEEEGTGIVIVVGLETAGLVPGVEDTRLGDEGVQQLHPVRLSLLLPADLRQRGQVLLHPWVIRLERQLAEGEFFETGLGEEAGVEGLLEGVVVVVQHVEVFLVPVEEGQVVVVVVLGPEQLVVVAPQEGLQAQRLVALVLDEQQVARVQFLLHQQVGRAAPVGLRVGDVDVGSQNGLANTN